MKYLLLLPILFSACSIPLVKYNYQCEATKDVMTKPIALKMKAISATEATNNFKNENPGYDVYMCYREN